MISFLKSPLFYLQIYQLAGFNAGIFLVDLRFQKLFMRWTRYCIIEIQHDPDANEIQVQCP